MDSVELPSAEMVVHESLRLYPPNWVLITCRSLQESTIGDHRIPKGSWLYIFPYVSIETTVGSRHPNRFTLTVSRLRNSVPHKNQLICRSV